MMLSISLIEIFFSSNDFSVLYNWYIAIWLPFPVKDDIIEVFNCKYQLSLSYVQDYWVNKLKREIAFAKHLFFFSSPRFKTELNIPSLSAKSNLHDKCADTKRVISSRKSTDKTMTKRKRTHNDLQTTTKDWATRTPLKTGGELRYLLCMNLSERLLPVHVVNGL